MLLTDLVGREAELAVIDRFLDAAARDFRCLVFEGEAGIGKTMLSREALVRAEAGGVSCLSCHPAASETRLSYAALTDLLAGVTPAVLAALPAPQRSAIEVTVLHAEAPPTPLDQRAIAMAFLSVLRELAASNPLLIAVDDAHWLDRPTASILQFAARRLTSEPVGIMTAVRVTDGRERTFVDVVDPDRRETARLGPLTLAALHELLAARLGHRFLRPTLVDIAQLSRGNPFYALEIGREILRDGEHDPRRRARVPGDVRKLVSNRVRRLPAETRDALLVASALARPTTALVDPQSLGPAEQADIVRIDADGTVRFTHPLYAAAVYESASHSRRQHLHTRLASLVDDLEERARHLAFAVSAPDEDIAAMLEKAARHARAHGAPGAAAELLDMARRLTPPQRAEDVVRRSLSTAEQHWHAGDAVRARTVLEDVLAVAAPGPLRGEALRLCGDIRRHESSFPAAIQAFQEALEHLQDERSAVLVELGLVHAYVPLRDMTQAMAHAQRARERADAVGDGPLQAEALAVVAMVDFLAGNGVDWDLLERACALEDPDRVVPIPFRPTLVEGLLLLYTGRLAESRIRLMTQRSRLIEHGWESDLPYVLSMLSWLDLWRGDLASALALAEESAALADIAGRPSLRAIALGCQAAAHAYRGEGAETRQRCAEAAVVAGGHAWSTAALWAGGATALLELSLGNPGGACQALTPLIEAVAAHGVGEPVFVHPLPLAIEGIIQSGELGRAETLLDAFEGRARELDRTWAVAMAARCRGLLLAAHGDLVGAEAGLAAAIVEHGRLEMPLELARTLLSLGQVQRRRKQRAAARHTFRRALEIFQGAGALLWAEKADEEIRRTGVCRTPERLSASEERVARLAARGLTIKDIAAQLFLSRRTVESNLARVYAKLDIRSRAELGAAMAEAETIAGRSERSA